MKVKFEFDTDDYGMNRIGDCNSCPFYRLGARGYYCVISLCGCPLEEVDHDSN